MITVSLNNSSTGHVTRTLGWLLGIRLGNKVGTVLGFPVGEKLGILLGDEEGNLLGIIVGILVG